MRLVGSGEQATRHFMYDASGTITTGGTAQLLLPQHLSRSSIFFTNNSTGTLYLDVGGPRATCSISGGKVTSSFTITNAGLGYTKPPVIIFLGGGLPQSSVSAYVTGPNTSYVGAGGPGFPSPPHPAKAHAVLTSGAVTSIVLDDPGAGYVAAPMVFMFNSDLDPNGVAAASATSGFAVIANGSVTFNATVCPTEPVSIFGATTGQAFTCKFST